MWMARREVSKEEEEENKGKKGGYCLIGREIRREQIRGFRTRDLFLLFGGV